VLREVLLRQPAVAPDGSSVAYAQRTIEGGEYRSRIWRVGWRGGRPERLTAGDIDTRPRFSPDGKTLLFLSSRSGSIQPWLLPLGGGEPVPLCEVPGGVTHAEWAPDGARVLLVARSGVPRFAVGDSEQPVARRIDTLFWRLDGVGIRDETAAVWIVRARGGRARRLTPPELDVYAAAWSGTADQVLVLSDRRSDGLYPQLWSLPLDGGGPRLVAELAGAIESVAVGPDGRIAILGYEQGPPLDWQNLGLFVREGRAWRRLGAQLDRPLAPRILTDLVDLSALFAPPLAWTDEGNVVALVTDRGNCHPYRFGLDGSLERLAGPDGACSDVSAAGGHIAVLATERGRAGEVCAVEDGRLRPLTRDGGRWLSPFRRDPERIAVPQASGPELDAWLLRGHGARRRRLVLQIHGGPHLAHGSTPWLEMIALASAGFSVLYGNPRGSVGSGEGFAGAILGNWGSVDADDVLRLADWAVAKGVCRPDRIGLLGLSYGGYMTNWLLGRHPGRFKAAVSENPVTDLIGMFGSSDVGWLLGRSAAGIETPGDGWERLLDRSPIRDLHRNESPLLLLQAENDLRCPPGQSEIAFAVLRSLGRTVELARYPGEAHTLIVDGQPVRRVDRLERIVSWFERYL
jgi:dipeptidyl aminopeptidase/acylaminoacyl peptidase